MLVAQMSGFDGGKKEAKTSILCQRMRNSIEKVRENSVLELLLPTGLESEAR
jgi:hypothetical protein